MKAGMKFSPCVCRKLLLLWGFSVRRGGGGVMMTGLRRSLVMGGGESKMMNRFILEAF